MAKAKTKQFVSQKGELMWMFIDGEDNEKLKQLMDCRERLWS